MLLLNALSDKSRWCPILVVFCAGNVGEVYATGFVFLAGRVWRMLVIFLCVWKNRVVIITNWWT